MAEIFNRLGVQAARAVSTVLSRQREEPRDRRNAAERGERPRQMRPPTQRLQDRTPSVREQAQAEVDRQRTAAEREAAIDEYAATSAPPNPTAFAPPATQQDLARARENIFVPRFYASFRPDYWTPRVAPQLRQAAMGDVDGDVPRAPPLPGPDAGRRAAADATALAARVTGAPQGYLRALAGQEGLDDPNAQNPRSSANGLMQFTEATWLAMLARHGRQYGLPDRLANAIQPTRRGGFRVADRAARDEIMRLRSSGEWSAIMGGHLFHEEAETMQRVRGRPVHVNEVYLGHFLGGVTAGKWIQMIDRGRGGVDARTAIRQLDPDGAARIIEQNPRQFAPGVTVQGLYQMQTGEFVVHGIERGESREELTAMVRPRGRAQTRQQGTLQSSRALAAEQQRQQNADRFGDPDAASSAPRINRFTGEPMVETAEERRMREQEEQEIAQRAARQRRTSVAVEGDRLRVRVPFN